MVDLTDILTANLLFLFICVSVQLTQSLLGDSAQRWTFTLYMTFSLIGYFNPLPLEFRVASLAYWSAVPLLQATLVTVFNKSRTQLSSMAM